MSNELKYVRRLKTGDDGKTRQDGYAVYGGEDQQTHLGKVRRIGGPGSDWSATYEAGDYQKAAGTYDTRDAAGHALAGLHDAAWAERHPLPEMPGKLDPRPPRSRYAVLEGEDLSRLHRDVAQALYTGGRVRFTVHNGLKYDAGNGWTAALGRAADETGH